MALLCKNKKEGGSARASPVAAPMPKSVSFLEKRECLDCLDCLELAYLSPMRWSCIYSRCSTSWMVTWIHSHWMGYFLLLLVSDLVEDIERAVYLR